jgi:hypothetical protein
MSSARVSAAVLEGQASLFAEDSVIVTDGSLCQYGNASNSAVVLTHCAIQTQSDMVDEEEGKLQLVLDHCISGNQQVSIQSSLVDE